LLLFSVLAAQAQMKEGKVVYERSMQMRMRGMSTEAAAIVPESRKDNFELMFGNNQSLWQVIPGEEGNNSTFSGERMIIRIAGNTDIIYTNFGTNKRVDQRDIMDREYLVEDSLRKLEWKTSDETKSILGYTARKAVAQRVAPQMRMTMENGQMKREETMDTSVIVAWFTSDIPVPAGPPEFGGQLPGLILELNVNNGRQVYKALEITPKVKVADIKEPKGGKRITSQEFIKEREKLMEEMRKNNPGGNRIRINN